MTVPIRAASVSKAAGPALPAAALGGGGGMDTEQAGSRNGPMPSVQVGTEFMPPEAR